MADDPVEAGVPGSTGPTRVYDGDGIRVVWDATLCIHTANCLRASPEVFDTSRRPWVDVGRASAEVIAAAIETCPTGALRYESTGDLPPEQAAEPTTVEVQRNGPLFVRGPLLITDSRDRLLAEGPRFALCRCGQSRNRPFCDNTHRDVGFVG